MMNDGGIWTCVVVREDGLQGDGLAVDGRKPCGLEVGVGRLVLANCVAIVLVTAL